MTDYFCAFCECGASAIIDSSDTPICHHCLDIYMCGQGNPKGTFTDIDDYETEEDDDDE